MATALNNVALSIARVTPGPGPNGGFGTGYSNAVQVLSTWSGGPKDGENVYVDSVNVGAFGTWEGENVVGVLWNSDSTTLYYEPSSVSFDDGLIGSVSTDFTSRLPTGSKVWLLTVNNTGVEFTIANAGSTVITSTSGANVIVGPNRRRKWQQLGLGGGIAV
tara:strand:+ start:204 stop:689 length:486 start_codon:yes stop_codon:yes gene_type:complete